MSLPNRYYVSSTSDFLDPRSMQSIIVPGICVLFGVIALFATIHLCLNAITLSNSGIVVQGRVIKVQEQQKRDSNGRYRTDHVSRIEFYTTSGARVETQQEGEDQVGASVRLIYDPQNPKNVSRDSFAALWGTALCFLVGTIIFGGLGGFLLYKLYVRRKDIKWLHENGMRIRAKVIGIKEHVNHDSDSSSQTRKSYQIVCESNENGHRATRFESDRFAQHPGDDCIGKEVEVIIDSQNPDVFYVDVETLQVH